MSSTAGGLTVPGLGGAACLERFGRLDGLVSNAATIRHLPLAEWDTGGFDEHLAVNVRAPFFLIQATLPALRESPVRSARSSRWTGSGH